MARYPDARRGASGLLCTIKVFEISSSPTRGVEMMRRATGILCGVLAISSALGAQEPPPAGRAAGPPAAGRASAPPPSPQSIERAAQILADARKAMGVDKLPSLQ